MDIRKVEPELIKPAQASDHGASVKMNRRPLEPEQRQRKQKRALTPQVDQEEEEPTALLYTPEGHVTEPEERTAHHTIDFTA